MRKLTLNKTTLRRLNASQLGRAAGGAPPGTDVCSGGQSCQSAGEFTCGAICSNSLYFQSYCCGPNSNAQSCFCGG